MHANWPMYLRILLGLHIACGITAFVCAPVALATAKGGKTHRLWGKIYFWAMAGVAVTALILSFALPIFFLAMVAVFSFYACFAAYRVLYLKDMYKGGKPLAWDWIAALITLASSFLLFLMGFLEPRLMAVGIIQIAGHPVSIVSVIFGIIGIRLATNSISDFLKPPKEKMFWWYSHLQGMIASYIAAMTAFSAVNLASHFGNAWWVWLWPTIVGAPAITIWTAYYKKKFAPRPKPASV
jgi:uncharacterized membrane protein